MVELPAIEADRRLIPIPDPADLYTTADRPCTLPLNPCLHSGARLKNSLVQAVSSACSGVGCGRIAGQPLLGAVAALQT